MDYILIAIICFLASYVGASMGSKGEAKDINPIAPIIKKVNEKKQEKESVKQSKNYDNWLWHDTESEEE